MIKPIVATSTDLLLGDGMIVLNFGELAEEIMGATRGDSVYTVTRESHNVDYDGKYGDTVGLDMIDTINGTLTINALSINANKMTKLFSATSTEEVVVGASSYDKVSYSLDVKSTDYIKNIAFIGETADGKKACFILDNAINLGNIEKTFTTKTEVVVNCTFGARYGADTPTEVPVHELYEV